MSWALSSVVTRGPTEKIPELHDSQSVTVSRHVMMGQLATPQSTSYTAAARRGPALPLCWRWRQECVGRGFLGSLPAPVPCGAQWAGMYAKKRRCRGLVHISAV